METHTEQPETGSMGQRRSIIEVTNAMVNSVSGMGPWVRFFSILGFISVGIMLIAGFVMLIMSIIGPLAAGNTGMPVFMMIIFSIIYLIMGGLYLMPSLYLFKAASAVIVLKQGSVKEGMEQSLENMRKFWKFVGIMLIVFLCLYPVFMGLMIFGMSTRLFH